jgi:hypothetical protein
MFLAVAALSQTQGTMLRTSAGPQRDQRDQRVERRVEHYRAFVWRSPRRARMLAPIDP